MISITALWEELSNILFVEVGIVYMDMIGSGAYNWSFLWISHGASATDEVYAESYRTSCAIQDNTLSSCHHSGRLGRTRTTW